MALLKLNKLNTKLEVTNGVLKKEKRQLNFTEDRISETQQSLAKTETQAETLSDRASKRLKEIYEGERLSFIEMMMQVNSLQSLLDRMYFQERIAEADKEILDELKVKSQVLADRKDRLGLQKRNLGEIVSDYAKQALAIAKEKISQEQTAQKLQTQRAFFEQAEQQLENESHRLESQIMEMETTNKRTNVPMTQGSGNMAMPLQAQITSPFGWRKHPIFHMRKFHTGVDLAGPNHSAIRAADSGNVLYTGWYGGYGKVVIVSHGGGMATLYAHLSRTAVSAGDNVQKGDVIAYEGTTGFSTGPHLHFEVRVNGKPNNPLNFVR